MSAQNPQPAKKKMFEVRPGQHRPKLIRNGALFFLFMVLATYTMYFRPPVPILSSTGTEFQADVADATNIRPGFTPVRVGGIDVGQVTEIDELGPRNGFRITMEMEDGTNFDEQVYADARADVRWRTLLGRNVYVDLDPGSKSKGKISGPIPESQTGGQIELDQAIDSFDETGRESVGTIVEQFNEGFADSKSVRSAVSSVAPAMKELAPALDALQGKKAGDLGRLVFQANRAVRALNKDEKALGGLVDNGAIALGVTAARRADLGETLRNAGGALQQTRSTAVRLRTTLDELDPLAADLRPGARVLDETAIETRSMLQKATPLLVDARPTLRDLAPAVRSGGTAARSGAPALTAFQPVLDTFKERLIPFFDETHRTSKRKNYMMVGPALSGASGVLATGDSKGSLARFQAQPFNTEGTVGGLSPCQTDLFDKTVEAPGGKIRCELLANIIANAFEGGGPQKASRFSNRTVPNDILDSIFQKKLSIDGAVKTLTERLKNVKVVGKDNG